MKPRTIMASSPSITALVPTMLAMTPPRSMSPTITTGTFAAREKPILAMSFGRRLASDALPAPSTRMRSASCFSLVKLSSTCGISVALIAWYSAARAAPNTLPCTTICAPVSLCGLSSTGFMWTLGATRAARACSACARPISPPSAVTAALFDMFCGLNGRTLRPRLAKARASPATISDLPTSEPVPWNMMARAVMRQGSGCRRKFGGCRCSFAPPSVLPDISPTRGEIGRPLGFRPSSTRQKRRRTR